MSFNSTIATITQKESEWAPTVSAAIQFAEETDASNEEKHNAVVTVVQAIAAGAQAGPIPSVAALGAMIQVGVAIFKALGKFKKKPAPIVPVPAAETVIP